MTEYDFLKSGQADYLRWRQQLVHFQVQRAPNDWDHMHYPIEGYQLYQLGRPSDHCLVELLQYARHRVDLECSLEDSVKLQAVYELAVHLLREVTRRIFGVVIEEDPLP